MKRFTLSLACAAALLMVAQAAWAGAFHMRAASGDIPSSSNCTRQVVNVPAGAPYTAMRCPSSGGGFNLNYTYPIDATAPGLTPRIHFTNPDASTGGFYCFTICMGVVLNGESRNALDNSQCVSMNQSLGNALASGTQNIMSDVTFPAPVTPDHVLASTACTTSACAGGELVIQISRDVSPITCPSNAGQNVDIHGVTLTYQ